MHTHTTAVHAFISTDLARESLSPECNQKREKFAQSLDKLCHKIRAAPPVMRPRMNTPSGSKPPAAPPPSTSIPDVTEEEEEGELYSEMDPIEEPTDYLAFEPSQMSGGELSQEMYEEMTIEHDQMDDVYEEPGECVCVCVCV